MSIRIKLLSILGWITLTVSACTTGVIRPFNHQNNLQNSLKDDLNSNPQSNRFDIIPTDNGAKGIASWYGRRFHKQKTASGERFNMYALTAAHRTLPFGSQIRVKNLRSGKSVILRINDRGPYRGNRLIDVSYKAGLALGMVSTGIAPVMIEVIHHAL